MLWGVDLSRITLPGVDLSANNVYLSAGYHSQQKIPCPLSEFKCRIPLLGVIVSVEYRVR